MSLFEAMTEIVGVPTNDLEHTFLYLSCASIAVMFFYIVPYMFKLISSTLKRF